MIKDNTTIPTPETVEVITDSNDIQHDTQFVVFRSGSGQIMRVIHPRYGNRHGTRLVESGYRAVGNKVMKNG
jgi:hypothetical protein